MGFFTRLFGGSVGEKEPEIHFGRYSDRYKSKVQNEAWEKAQNLFEEGKYLDSYESFLFYLKDKEEKNVSYLRAGNYINFSFFQGSKKVEGRAFADRVEVEAQIARVNQLDEEFMERLLRRNFDLKYARFALDDKDYLKIKFDTSTLDGSPYKLYFALKELATHADKQDDLLAEDFQHISLLEVDHLEVLPEEEKNKKYDYFIQEIEKACQPIIDHGKSIESYAGAVGYHLLNTAYKLDYLIRPEGVIMETLERIHRLYFASDDLSLQEKVALVRKEYQKLAKRSQVDFTKEMYRVTSTFGITNPVDHERVQNFIDGELGNMDWYKENGYYDTALAIPGYIVGYCMFNFAIPFPDKAFFHLYYQIMESEYFKNLGFPISYYDISTQQFDKKAIKKAIKAIVKDNKEQFPKLNPTLSTLDFSTKVDFAPSFLKMVRNLNMVKYS